MNEDVICLKCKHCDSKKDAKRIVCNPMPQKGKPVQYYEHDKGSLSFVRFFGWCYEKRPPMPCFHIYQDGKKCSRNINGQCTHSYYNYEDCQDGWQPIEYDQLHGSSACERRKIEIEKVFI